MSKLNGMQIFELMSDMDDSLIAESAAPAAFLAATAVGTAAVAGTMSTSASASSAKAGFGARLAKGGWVALVAGAVAAAGVAVGAFLLGNGEDEPPAGEEPGVIETSDDRETEAPTGEDTVETAEEDTAETAEEDTAEVVRYFQFPLLSARDTLSYVSVPDLNNEPNGAVEFFIHPYGAESPDLISVYKLNISKKFPMNMQVVSVKSDKFYGILYMMEKAQPDTQDIVWGYDGIAGIECYILYFYNSGDIYFSRDADYDANYGCYDFGYKEGQKVSITQYRTYQYYLRKAEKLIESCSDASRFEYTVLYSYIDGVETVNQPVESIPEFPFSIWKEYIEPDWES